MYFYMTLFASLAMPVNARRCLAWPCLASQSAAELSHSPLHHALPRKSMPSKLLNKAQPRLGFNLELVMGLEPATG